jgi:hypothetical protein
MSVADVELLAYGVQLAVVVDVPQLPLAKHLEGVEDLVREPVIQISVTQKGPPRSSIC